MWIFALIIQIAAADSGTAVEAALAARHPVSCEEIWALGPVEEVRDHLILAASEAELPPWKPLRAASCVAALAQRDSTARAAVLRWVQDPSRLGVALAVVEQNDLLPADLTREIAIPLRDHLAANPIFARRVAPLLRESRHPALTAIAP